MTGESMANETQKQSVWLEELPGSTLAMTDALAKLLIAKASLAAKSLKRISALSERTISRC
jgi:hypothetical protein